MLSKCKRCVPLVWSSHISYDLLSLVTCLTVWWPSWPVISGQLPVMVSSSVHETTHLSSEQDLCLCLCFSFSHPLSLSPHPWFTYAVSKAIIMTYPTLPFKSAFPRLSKASPISIAVCDSLSMCGFKSVLVIGVWDMKDDAGLGGCVVSPSGWHKLQEIRTLKVIFPWIRWY